MRCSSPPALFRRRPRIVVRAGRWTAEGRGVTVGVKLLVGNECANSGLSATNPFDDTHNAHTARNLTIVSISFRFFHRMNPYFFSTLA